MEEEEGGFGGGGGGRGEGVDGDGGGDGDGVGGEGWVESCVGVHCGLEGWGVMRLVWRQLDEVVTTCSLVIALGSPGLG